MARTNRDVNRDAHRLAELLRAHGPCTYSQVLALLEHHGSTRGQAEETLYRARDLELIEKSPHTSQWRAVERVEPDVIRQIESDRAWLLRQAETVVHSARVNHDPALIPVAAELLLRAALA